MIADDSLLQARLYLEVFHQAILVGDKRRAKAGALQYENLVRELNGGSHVGSYANELSPGCLLKNQLEAPDGSVPMWGQQGEFIIALPSIKARVRCEDTPRCTQPVVCFSLHALDPFEPFVSETGFRSIMVEPWGMTVDAAVRSELERLVGESLCMVKPQHRKHISVPAWAMERVAEIESMPVIASDGQLSFF